MKLTLRLGVLIAVSVAISAGCGLWALSRCAAETTRMVSNDMERPLALGRAQRVLTSLPTLEREYLRAPDLAQRAHISEIMDAAAVQLQDQLNKYALLMPSEDAPLVARIGEASARWYALDERVRATAQRDVAEARLLAAQHGLDSAAWDDASDALAKRNEARLANRAAHTRTTYRTAAQQLAALSAFVALLAGWLHHALLAGLRRQLAARVEEAKLDTAGWRVVPNQCDPSRVAWPAAHAQSAGKRGAPRVKSAPRPRRIGAFR
jgi:hypothetical protein